MEEGGRELLILWFGGSEDVDTREKTDLVRVGQSIKKSVPGRAVFVLCLSRV